MIKQFEKLTTMEQRHLFKAPVLLSLLASCSYNDINKSQKADAIKLSHLRTFTAEPLLVPYYTEVEKHFKEQFEAEIKKYLPFDEAKRNEIKIELERMSLVIAKLNREYSQALRKSLESYAMHVKKAAHSILQDFIFPLPIAGLTD